MKNIILNIENVYIPIFSLSIQNNTNEGIKINISQMEKRSCEKDEVRGTPNINFKPENKNKSRNEDSIKNPIEDKYNLFANIKKIIIFLFIK